MYESKPDTVLELTAEEKKHELYLQQKLLLDTFLAHGTITPAQHEKSLHDLTVKMHEGTE